MRLLHCLEIRNFKRFGDTQRIELDRADSDDGGLRISYWRRYECENYVVTPDTLRSFARDRYKDAPPLFEGLGDDIDEVLDTLILERVFEGREDDFAVWKAAGPAAGRLLWVARTERLKLSTFAEDFFRRLAERFGHAMLLRKGELYRLVDCSASRSTGWTRSRSTPTPTHIRARNGRRVSHLFRPPPPTAASGRAGELPAAPESMSARSSP